MRQSAIETYRGEGGDKLTLRPILRKTRGVLVTGSTLRA